MRAIQALVIAGLAASTFPATLASESACVGGLNRALVFVKPEASSQPSVVDRVREILLKHGIEVVDEGMVDGATVDKEGLIDVHYGAIAYKAVTARPADVAISAAAAIKFKDIFGENYEAALARGAVLNAREACSVLGLDAQALGNQWASLTMDRDMVKFGGGHYCGRLLDVFVVNGFYMAMRSQYVAPRAHVKWMSVEWPEATLSWHSFRKNVVGATDPTKAAPGSIRRSLLEDWKALGLDSEPSTKANGFHASASPLEGLSERMNWLRLPNAASDPYGAELLKDTRISETDIERWRKDPLLLGDADGSLFDACEDMDSTECANFLRTQAS